VRRGGAAVISRTARAVTPLAVLLLLGLLVPRRAHATLEEFSTFDVEVQEEDNKTILDHLLARNPVQWRDEWERSAQAFRTSQGCVTSGQWVEFTDLKVESALGERARLGVLYTQRFDNTESYDDLALLFRYPIRVGRATVEFHPSFDKSRQDFALNWDTGPDTSAFYLSATFVVEDMLNNLWAWRQSRVGNASEPYVRHPYEPELEMISRHDHWRLDLGGRYLSPSTKQVQGFSSADTLRLVTLWGAIGWAAVEADAFGFHWQARTDNKQALSTDQPVDFSTGDNHNFRRQWSCEAAVSKDFSPRYFALARWLYEGRTEIYGAPAGPGRFDALDRVGQLEVGRVLNPRWRLRVGGLYDRIAHDREGITPGSSQAGPKRSRAYISLQGRFGKVSIEGTEGIQHDQEPYQVVWHHDKGFLKLQTTF
jgi:hypothetical protein